MEAHFWMDAGEYIFPLISIGSFLLVKSSHFQGEMTKLIFLLWWDECSKNILLKSWKNRNGLFWDITDWIFECEKNEIFFLMFFWKCIETSED